MDSETFNHCVLYTDFVVVVSNLKSSTMKTQMGVDNVSWLTGCDHEKLCQEAKWKSDLQAFELAV